MTPSQPQLPVDSFSQPSQQTVAQSANPKKPIWRRGTIWLIAALGFATIILFAAKSAKIFPEKTAPILAPQNQTDITPTYGYDSEWSETEKKFVLKKDSSEILSFQLTEKPLEVMVNPSKDTIAVVTTIDKMDKSAQNLYIYNGARLIKIFTGGKFNVNEDDDNLRNLPERISVDQFSPDGKYLLFSLSEWETTGSFIVPTDTSNPIDFNQRLKSPFDLIYWKQDRRCLLNINSPGMYGPALMLGQLDKNPTFSYLRFNQKSNSLEYTAAYDFDASKIKVYWRDNCSGLLYLEEDLQFKKSGSRPASAYFRFAPNQENAVSEIPNNLEDYQQGFPLESIILTPKYID